MQDDFLKESDRGSVTLLVLLDPSVAFDTDDLLDWLLGLEIRGLVHQRLQCFLDGYVQKIQLGEVLLTTWTLYSRVPRGLIISPMLFNIYVKPLGEVIQRFEVPCYQYADDIHLSLIHHICNRCHSAPGMRPVLDNGQDENK